VSVCDNRGSAGRGMDFQKQLYNKMGTVEIEVKPFDSHLYFHIFISQSVFFHIFVFTFCVSHLCFHIFVFASLFHIFVFTSCFHIFVFLFFHILCFHISLCCLFKDQAKHVAHLVNQVKQSQTKVFFFLIFFSLFLIQGIVDPNRVAIYGTSYGGDF
jgi:hypothetical protein